MCFGWYFHPSSGAHTTVSPASGICHTVTAICRYRGRVVIGLSVLWVAYATHSTLKPVTTLPRQRQIAGRGVGRYFFSNKVPRWLKSAVLVFRCLSLSSRNITWINLKLRNELWFPRRFGSSAARFIIQTTMFLLKLHVLCKANRTAI